MKEMDQKQKKIVSNTDLTYWDTVQENIDNIRAQYNPKILICGDLNADLKTTEFVIIFHITLMNQRE